MPLPKITKELLGAAREGNTDGVKALLEEAGHPLQGDNTRATSAGIYALTWGRRAERDRHSAAGWERYGYREPARGREAQAYADERRRDAEVADGNRQFFTWQEQRLRQRGQQ